MKNKFKKIRILYVVLAMLPLILGCSSFWNSIEGATRAPEVFNQPMEDDNYRNNTNKRFVRLVPKQDSCKNCSARNTEKKKQQNKNSGWLGIDFSKF